MPRTKEKVFFFGCLVFSMGFLEWRGGCFHRVLGIHHPFKGLKQPKLLVYKFFGTFVGDVSWRPAFAKLVVLMEFFGQGMSFSQTAGCMAKTSQLRTTIVLIRENRYTYLPWDNVIARPFLSKRFLFRGEVSPKIPFYSSLLMIIDPRPFDRNMNTVG